MLKSEWVGLAATSLVLLSGCGGEGGDDAKCSDFRYQEDAQQAYRAGAKQLDGDKDGIACESLPHRPSQPSQPSTPTTSYTSKTFLTAHGTLIELAARSGGYSFSYADVNGGAGGATGPVAESAAGGGQEVSAVGRAVRYYRTSDGFLLAWAPALGSLGPAPGVGVEATGSPAALSDIAGTYKVLGQRCLSDTSTCNSVAATARISSNGALRLCIGAEYSDTCTPGISRTLSPANTILSTTNAWSVGSSGESLVVSATRGTIAFSYRDVQLDTSQQPISTDNFTFFGQRDNFTANTVPSASMLSFDVNGQVKATVPDANGWAVGANKPLQGFFQDGAGNTYLQSTTGQLVTWTVGSGMQIYSKP
ncbi:excalibur calcium-binding domain-containing protein (plasmid) [Cupriavidus necator]|nr:excalibur calcium-binding domain-containing protein [Cupriavidus necator]